MDSAENLIGVKFGKLIVVEDLGRFIKEGTKSKRHYYKCRCTCDKQTVLIIDKYKLLSGHTTSCGCRQSEVVRKRNKEDNPSKYIIKSINENYVDNLGVGHIKMSNTNNEMLCDAEYIDELLKYYWYECEGYAKSSNGKNKKVYAHRIVMDAGDYDFNNPVDHINGNTLDNRRQNLRIVTVRQNVLNTSIRKDNTSGVTGVCWDKRKQKWLVRIYDNGKEINLGYFNDFENAVQVRKEAEEKYYGEYSRDNSRAI